MKKKKLALNTIMPLLLEIVSITSGFILPRLILTHYGSEVNGLVQSITQFLAVISFFEAGVGSVVRYNFFKPLAEHDGNQISRVVVSANKFFRKLAIGLLAYTVLLMIFYPLFAGQQFGHMYTALLIAAMCISFFAQYYFGQVNQLLLTADQRGYIQCLAQIGSIVANTIACVILIIAGASIHVVKLTTSVIFFLRPLFLDWYVKRHYNIDYSIKYGEEPIKQKWNGLAQHISAVVLDGTDVIVLTALSTLGNVSIYSTYNLVVGNIKKMITTATGGIEAATGDIIARGNKEELTRTFEVTEWTIHTVGTFIFSCTAALVTPFVMVYTKGVTDVNYNVPLFAVLLTIANYAHTLRLPYSITILTAGHYKQTQHCYIIAAITNIMISVILVSKFGLIGVAIGTVIAMFYQTIWMSWYAGEKILGRSYARFWKQFIVDGIIFAAIILSSKLFDMKFVSYGAWFILAVKVAIVSLIIVLIVNGLFYRDHVSGVYKKVKNKCVELNKRKRNV